MKSREILIEIPGVYFVTFLDKATGHITVVQIKTKNQASAELTKYIAWVGRQTVNKFRKLALDGAETSDYEHAVQTLTQKGIVFDTCAP